MFRAPFASWEEHRQDRETKAAGETDNDYEVYEGALGGFATHRPVSCTTLTETFTTLTPQEGSRYYLVVPRNFFREGSYGRASDGAERPPSSAPCVPQLTSSCP